MRARFSDEVIGADNGSGELCAIELVPDGPTAAGTLPAMPTSAQAARRSVTIVLPAYNEAKRIGPALDELFAYLDAPPVEGVHPRIDVLVVDDGSTDGTAELIRARPEAARPRDTDQASLAVMPVPHAGKGSAVKAGMLAAQGDLVVFADADMATPPGELPKLVKALDDADVALGSRIQPDGSDMRATQPRYRRLLGGVFHALASIWVVGDVKDTQCGFKGFTREAAHDLFSRQRITSIVFDVELVHLARRRGYRLAVVPIRWQDVRGSRLRPGLRLAAEVAWDLFRIPLLHRSVRKRR
jgi:dolichyl-phosphate beta-glucosyltransferase